MNLEVFNQNEMKDLGQHLGGLLKGGEVLELIGDVGAGKTTFTKGLALGLGVDENVQSPSFTINANYVGSSGLRLSHFDFYRLQDAGIMSDALSETLEDNKTVVVVEWAGLVEGVLPEDRLIIKIFTTGEDSRRLELGASDNLQYLLEGLGR